MRTWLPRLVGIERSIALRVGSGDDAVLLRAQPEAAHAEQLTRDEITASVHYISWELTEDEVAKVEEGPVSLVVDHEEYQEQTELPPATVAELLVDLRG
ncbi:MAG: DUF3501 family protein, partial [Acidimicrobiales bacterium]|nr:DUF3501 family protein [Acidimicrobiales bacterium]